MAVKDLTPAQCVLLTVHLASESNIKALHSFTPSRLDALDPDLVLRILLTYLPESLDPREYTNYVSELSSRLYLDFNREEVPIDLSAVQYISDEQARKRVKKLHLLELKPPKCPPHAPQDALTWFLCHRAYRIDRETGLISLVPALIEPFLDRNDYLRAWYIAVLLPVLRLETDFYPDDPEAAVSLGDFEKLEGREGVDILLRSAIRQSTAGTSTVSASTLSRDIKGLVGPWMFGHPQRKQRWLDAHSKSGGEGDEQDETAALSLAVRKININDVEKVESTGHDWEYMYRWLVHHAVDHFGLISHAIEEWDGPSDVDLGDYDRKGIGYLDQDLQSKLELQYAQAAFASCYAAQADSQETVRAAHGILARLAELLQFIPPPDLATSVDSLPRIERHATKLEKSQTTADLQPNALMRGDHPLTTPKFETYMLLQMMVYSAYQFAGLGQPQSLSSVCRLHFYAERDEQLETLRKILRGLVSSGVRKEDAQWAADRAKLIWLWNWGIESDDKEDGTQEGAGVLGKIAKSDFEEELLRVFTETACYQLVIKRYIKNVDQSTSLPLARTADIILSKAMEAYDSASNGNKTRGGLKKANEIILAFLPNFSDDPHFQQAIALIAATHSLSFYSLTLQHGVPFQPVSIRVIQDPLSLISKVLEQNPKSYTKLDDLVSIAQNLVSAGLATRVEDPNSSPSIDPTASEPHSDNPDATLSDRRLQASRRATFMAIEAALREDDFETAYSYTVSRLTPSGADVQPPLPLSSSAPKLGHAKRPSRNANAHKIDDISWRAAFLAGRFRPSSSTSTANLTPAQSLRRLEQRTDLLALALLLAPQTALTEILAAWRRCEEETSALHASLQESLDAFDDRADRRLANTTSTALPGTFSLLPQPDLVLNQTRREVGRAGAAHAGPRRDADETPLSMFDLTRSAARALRKNAFPLAGPGAASATTSQPSSNPAEPSAASADGRVRKRDLVANAVSGGLASGLGWVLGATPVSQSEQQL